MKHLLSAMALTACVGAFAVPTLVAAADMDPKTMTCADFSAMDMDGMMKAVEMMHAASPDAATAMDEAAMKMANDHTTTACDGHPEMLAMDAMMMK